MMSFKYALRASFFFVLLLRIGFAQAQVDFSQEKEFLLQNDSLEMRLWIPENTEVYTQERPLGVFWDTDQGYECFFSLQKISIGQVLEVYNGKWEASKRKPLQKEINEGNPEREEMVFFNEPKLTTTLSDNNWCIYAKEKRREEVEKMTKAHFKKACKELLLNFLAFKETPCNVDSYRWEINTAALKKKTSLKFDKELDQYHCTKTFEKQKMHLENARIKDVLNFIENHYYKKLSVTYEKGFHPILVGNYRFRKMTFPLDYSFNDFLAYLTQEYGIELKPEYGAFKGKAYAPQDYKPLDPVSFEDYEVYDYEDEYIKVKLKFSDQRWSVKNEKPILTTYEEVYMGMGTHIRSILQYLHYGITRTGEKTYKVNVDRKQHLFYQLKPYGQYVSISAENLRVDEVEEDEFRRRVEAVLLKKLGIEKKTVDQNVYRCSYDLDKVKALDNFQVSETQNGFSLKYESNRANRDTIGWHLRLPSDPQILLTLRIRGYDLLCEKTNWANYKRTAPTASSPKEYLLRDTQLPRNDLDNLIAVFEKKYGITITKTDKIERVLLYKTIE